MPFIACLNNVKTTHARKHMPFPRRPFTRNETNQRTPDPTHNQGMSRTDSSHTATRKETGSRREDNYTLTTHHPPGMTPDRLRAVKMLASTMQISNNNPTNPTHNPTGLPAAKEEQRKTQEPHPRTPRPTATRHARAGSLISQGPTVCQHQPHPHPTPGSTPTRQAGG